MFWLVVPTVLALVSAHPSVLVIVAVALIARRWMPDPVQIVRTSGRARALEAQLALNPANATASAQLAEIRLAGWRPGRAIPLLERALTRDPKSSELHYLLGLARLRAGRPEPALEPLAEALALDPKVRYGSAYLAIGEALAELGRLDEAIDAFERYVRINTSSLEGYCKLARARQLPRFQRRRQFRWWIKAKFAA
jgi:tetratricopeptide (TPR) repeat protein